MRRVLLVLLCCVSWVWSNAWSAPELSGRTRFQFGPNNATVSFGADAIVNNSEAGRSGSIRVQLWALRSPYTENGLRGHLIAGFDLAALYAGNEYRPSRRTMPASLPPRRGSYYIALVVSEYQGNGYVITDYRNYDDPVDLAPAELFRMRGPWGWQSDQSDGTVNMWVKLVSHSRTGRTGALRLSVWATEEPYQGGRIRGYELARVEKKPLTAGYVYNDLNDTVDYNPPPPGEYYTTLFLTEFDGNEYVIRAYLPADDTIEFE